ncbi:MAG: tRNA (pseudouridine(54)-N(1))-methyltransferase TrmY [Candidatus Aenigmatarchaeota archaeon]
MREFILRTSKGSTDYKFDIDNLPKSGRMDIVCRCVINALFVSESIRRDTVIHVVLTGPPKPSKIVSFYGNRIEDLYPYERNIAKLIKIGLWEGRNLKENESLEYKPGIVISKKKFETLVKEKIDNQLFYLHKDGIPVKDFKFEENFVAILSDYKKLPSQVESFLKELKIEKVSLGKIEYFSSQVINILHFLLDGGL